MIIALKDYIADEVIYQGQKTTIFRAKRKGGSLSVVLKYLKPEFVDERNVKRLQNEFEILYKLHNPHIAAVYDLVPFESSLFLVMEDVSFGDLAKYIEESPLNLTSDLEIAIQIAEAIGEIHQEGVIHKDIKPANILITPQKQIKIIDFGIATTLTREVQEIAQLDELEGTLAYISPEQTGRINRPLDYRSDIYSLGVTFYQLFTGKLPFEANTAMELVHLHIAQQPLPPEKINPKIPKVLSAIILKCLQKDVENRYKSAFGLMQDLQKCLELLRSTGSIPEFPLGENDIYVRFHIPDKLFGREKELAVIDECVDSACNGKMRVLILNGYSGIGKSSLVVEAQEKIARKHGRFAASQIVQMENNIPYKSGGQIVNTLIHQILTESDDVVEDWRIRIMDVVEQNGQVLTDMIPDLKLIIGEQPPVEKLTPQETDNRFKYVLNNFIKLFATRESPLVLLFDGFQWCDEATINFLLYALQDPFLKYILVIISYRDNELSEIHPVHIALNELKKKNLDITTLTLTGLGVGSVKEIIQDVFPRLQEWELKELTTLVEHKTHGNPFFIIQFLKYLYDNQFVQFDKAESKWIAKIKEINQLQVSDNVVDFLIQKIKGLNQSLINVLKVCSVIGNKFQFKVVQAYFGWQQSELLEVFKTAMLEDLIIQNFQLSPDDEGISYTFIHDRIQQLCYEFLDDQEKAETHFRIGQVLYVISSLDEFQENLIVIANHLNYGLEFPLDNDQKAMLLQMNHEAGIKAKDSQSLALAIVYFKNATGLLESDCWISQYAMTFSLYHNLGVCLQVSGAIEESEVCFNLCIENAQTITEKVQLYAGLITLYDQSQGYEKIFVYAKKAIDLLGFTFDLDPGIVSIGIQIVKTKIRLSFWTVEQIQNLPFATDENRLMYFRLLASLSHAAYVIGKPYLLLGIALEGVNLGLTYGKSSSFPGCMSLYAAFLASDQMCDFEGATLYGTLAERLNQEFPNTLEVASGRIIYPYFISRWSEPVKDAIPSFWVNYRECLASGAVALGATSLLSISVFKLNCGERLELFKPHVLLSIQEVQKLATFGEEVMLAIMREACFSLMGESSDETDCCPPEFENQIRNEQHPDTQRLYLACYGYYRGFLLYLFGNYEKAIRHYEQLIPLSEKFQGSLEWHLTRLCYCLSITAMMKTPKENRRLWRALNSNKKMLEKWGKGSRFNFGCHEALVKAEIASLEDRFYDAERGYIEAVELAKESENTLLTAISYEVFARHYLRKQMSELAYYFIRKAYEYYGIFGAKAKCEQLQLIYQDCFIQAAVSSDVTSHSTRTFTTVTTQTSHTTTGTMTVEQGQGSFDLNTIIQASQALSKEIVFEKLSESLMKLMILNAGADKAFLILFDNEQPFVYSETFLGKPYVAIVPPVPLANRQDELSTAIVNYVARTKSEVLLNNASEEGAFTESEYALNKKPKSLLCLPLLQKGELKGILYLENTSSINVFTEKHLKLLTMLSSQMAISIENAQFYLKLEGKVEARTKELHEKNEELQSALTHIQVVQEQLIQQEKLASLGVLTAGIAHELKNPLNFVLNFSTIANDNLKDLVTEIETQNKEEQLTIIKEITDNLAVINTHATRANSIIKGMLAHAHQGSKEAETININTLLEEALGLAYYTYRKKDPSINVTFVKNFEADLKQVKAYPGDLLRVFINIIDNACFALSEKNRKGIEGYVPTLELTTAQQGKFQIITIKDNGTGMPEEVMKNIFNPFYTTKAPGVGTGLGLSIVYDIINKQHNGDITVSSEPGTMTLFVIKLPS